MMTEKTISKALRASVFITILISPPAMAAVSDPSQLFGRQSTRVSAFAVNGSAPQEEMVSQLMVKPRSVVGYPLHKSLLAHDASALVRTSNVPMSVLRQMSGGAHVIRLEQPVTLTEANAIAARLMSNSSVELAEPDLRRHPALIPTDPDYAPYQWNLFAPTSSQYLGSANLPPAWDITTGSNTVTVAVIDTGYRPHQDLGFCYSGSCSSSPAVLSSGYTFITDIPTANNGVGREPDALDPGDWITGAENTAITNGVQGPFYGCGTLNSRGKPVNVLTPSSWHGTHVSGIIAAQMNNGIGITGLAPNIQILPVRVLGKCGGYDSDIIDGMRWAAGIAVTGVPTNTHPAKVLSMSLGGSGGGTCPATYQSAVNDVISKGAVIVVAAGNDGSSTLSPPASCANVAGITGNGIIAVTANSIDGDNAWYATIGPGTTISAPGGDCGGMNSNCNPTNNPQIYPQVYSTLNSGQQGPNPSPSGDNYVAYSGTSMATPHVSAVAALMFSLNPSLTPKQVESYLTSNVRPFPLNTICTSVFPGQCGAGLLDAYLALKAVQAASPPSSKTSQTIGTISFSPATLDVNGSTTVSATATSSLPVVFSSTTPPVCSANGKTVTGTAAGTCTIAANQAGNTTYSAAPQVTKSITVISQNDCIFNWLEINYSQYFSPPGAADVTTVVPYTYRYYNSTRNYMVVSSADNNLYVLGTSFGPNIIDVGLVANFLGLTGC